jgi:ferredoxin-NADP reductase
VLLIGGGSGVVPLMAMVRLARATGAPMAHLVVSARQPADLIYTNELDGDDTTVIYTRRAPDTATRPPGRITATDIAPFVQADRTVFICGSAAFADAATERAVEAGVAPEAIRVERFGPTG